MKKKNESTGWIFASAVFSLIMLAVYLLISTGDEFLVVYTMAHQPDGYPLIPAGITVSGSPALEWGEVARGLKTAGWICFALIVVGNLIAWKYDYKFATLGTPWMRLALCIGPVLLCAIFWLGAYSSRLDLNNYTNSFDKFREEMKISDAVAADIVKSGGSGTFHIKDENGLLKEWFIQNHEKTKRK